jgi:hypothetical protein
MSLAGPARRALLIGSQTGKLKGVDSDVERMADALSRQGFALTIRTGRKASRDEILAAYETLIEDTRLDHAVCVYYSGHGNRAPNPHFRPGKRTPPDLQYIIPTDDAPDAFRGVMSFELSRLLARLTEKTRNVTVILDCCHSARMSRAAEERDLVPKAAPSRVNDEDLGALLRQSFPDESLLDVESNPHAVRLVAAEAQSPAFERLNERGEATSAFTEALLQVLAEIDGDGVSWNAVMLRVRELVMARIPEQRPDAEGPRRRRVWGLDEVPDQRPLPLFWKGDAPMIRGGALLGVVPGATYAVMPAASEVYVAARSLGTAVVEESVGSVSRVRLQGSDPATLPRTGLLAFPLAVPFRKCSVALAGDIPAALRQRIADSPHLLAADARTGALLPSVVAEGHSLIVRDAVGDRLLETSAASTDEVLNRLERMARAEELRALPPGRLDARLGVSFGRIESGGRVPMQAGETVHVGDLQYVDVENRGYAPIFVAVFGVDAAYGIYLMSRRATRGHRLVPKERLVLGQNVNGTLTGVAVSWPSSLPADRPRRESLIVFAADDEQDFQLLTTSGRSRGGAASALERCLDQIRNGSARTRGSDSPSGSEYSLRRVDYQLAPGPRTAGTGV